MYGRASSSIFLYRTTNNCESFHAKFNSSFYNTHPNIFLFIQVLLTFQTEIYVKIRTAFLYRKKVRKDTLKKLENINEKINSYKEGKISRFSFVKSVSYNYLPN